MTRMIGLCAMCVHGLSSMSSKSIQGQLKGAHFFQMHNFLYLIDY